MQNLTEIGQSAAQLWPKNNFQYGGWPLCWILNIVTFCHKVQNLTSCIKFLWDPILDFLTSPC